MSMIKYLVTKYSDTTMVYSNNIWIRVTNTLADTMLKSEYLVSKYLDTIMVYSNAFGIRVIIVDHMYLCPCDAELSLS